MSRSPKMTSYTTITSNDETRPLHYPLSSTSTSLAAAIKGGTAGPAAAPEAAVTSSSHQGSEWPRTLLTEPDNMIKTPTPAEGWNAAGTTMHYTQSASSSRSGLAANSARPVSEAELMAIVVEKRLKASSESFQAAAAGSRAGRSGSSSSGRERAREEAGRIASSLSSSSQPSRREGKDGQEIDTRDTLDLCYMRIEKLPEGLVDIIKNDVVRLALGYNLISKIPDNFVDLRCVRYLNVRANNLASFPPTLCKMPSLEILDISRNKIRFLPSEPGRLLSLRVLSLNSNRLTRLAPWVAKMKHLRVLKMENNPLEWPPPHISKMPSVVLPKPPSSAGAGAIERDVVRKFEEHQMVVWIAKLKNWINESQASKRMQSAQPLSATPDLEQPSEEDPNAADMLALPVVAPDPANADSTPADDSSTEAEAEPASDQSESPVTPKNSDAKQGDESIWSQLPLPTAEDRPPPPREGYEREVTMLPYDRHHSLPRQLPNDYAREPVPPIPKHFSPHTPTGAGSIAGSSSRADSRLATPDTTSVTTADGLPADTHYPVGRRAETVLSVKSQHGRNNSHTIGQAASPLQPGARRTLNAKKSLPDLRLSHEDILTEHSHSVIRSSAHHPSVGAAAAAASSRTTELPERASASHDVESYPHMPNLPLRRPSSAPRRPPLSQSANNPIGYHSKPGGWTSSNPSPSQTSVSGSGGGLRKLSLPTVGATQAAAEAAAAAMAARTPYTHTPPRIKSHGRMPSDKGDSVISSRSNSPTVARNPADFERNSYFRRLSTLPPSTIAKAVPLPVLKFVDGTRGVLFALSQIHAALKQYILFATDERISSQFNRVLDIASGSMTTFINSLDRFDSLSLRGTPEPSVIRGVLMTCKESVVTFRKVVSVLQLQLRALQSSADVRFTRTLLLMLYGSMAEVSNSWTTMAPQVDAVLPYLTAESANGNGPVYVPAPPPPSAGSGSALRPNGSLLKSGTAAASTSTLPSIAEAPTTVRPVRPYAQPQKPSRRRHAGSFSAHDVAQGANIPPSASQLQPFNLEDLQASAAYGTPARSGRRPNLTNGVAPTHLASTAGGTGAPEYISASQGQQCYGAAPATPTGGSGRLVGASSAPASPSKNRSNSNASSSGETSSFMAASSMGGMTPIAPASSAATSMSHHQQMHSKSLSNGTSAVGMGIASSNAAVTIDDHLLMLVDQMTGLSANVWTNLLAHLSGNGIESEPPTPTGPSTATTTAATGTRSRSNTATSLTDRERGHGQVQEVGERVDGWLAVAETAASLTKKLRDLRDLTHSTAELTSRLRETYRSVREEERNAVDGLLSRAELEAQDQQGKSSSGAAATQQTALDLIGQDLVKRLFEEAHQFVRAIVNISTLIKTISTSHAFPRELRRSLGEVTHGCSALTVHLLWLSPTSIS